MSGRKYNRAETDGGQKPELWKSEITGEWELNADAACPCLRKWSEQERLFQGTWTKGSQTTWSSGWRRSRHTDREREKSQHTGITGTQGNKGIIQGKPTHDWAPRGSPRWWGWVTFLSWSSKEQWEEFVQNTLRWRNGMVWQSDKGILVTCLESSSSSWNCYLLRAERLF